MTSGVNKQARTSGGGRMLWLCARRQLCVPQIRKDTAEFIQFHNKMFEGNETLLNPTDLSNYFI